MSAAGLDSEMALSLVDLLVRLARNNRTVCTTIHQPNRCGMILCQMKSCFSQLNFWQAGCSPSAA
jgi:ABC-type multidrug transport system ATPase subunit